ncbi:MAG: hypothetical protein ACI9KN_002312 [Gammaproteobacteria bacterium]|jgi:uncharacterized protein YjiS (DUF1127 family)
MKMLNFAIASMVDATTGSHLNQTSSQPAFSKKPVLRRRFLASLLGDTASFFDKVVTAYKVRSQSRKDRNEILQLSPRVLKDIGLSYEDIQGLLSNQLSFEELNSRRSEQQGLFNLRLTSPSLAETVVKSPELDAANQDHRELASCG